LTSNLDLKEYKNNLSKLINNSSALPAPVGLAECEVDGRAQGIQYPAGGQLQRILFKENEGFLK
jgi:hypothetical protein